MEGAPANFSSCGNVQHYLYVAAALNPAGIVADKTEVKILAGVTSEKNLHEIKALARLFRKETTAQFVSVQFNPDPR